MSNICAAANQKNSPFVLPELPYMSNALEPYMSEKTFSYHHKKHHKAYVDNLNKFVESDDSLKNKTLEEIILAYHSDSSKIGVFNNAAQVWNHSFFWHCMKVNGGGDPIDEIKSKINQDFGSYEQFVNEFKNAALTQFGSGWAWLVLNENNKLEIMKTGNADLPMVHKKRALLTIDVWEHAYYLDYQNVRLNYIETFLKHLVNWAFVNEMLK